LIPYPYYYFSLPLSLLFSSMLVKWLAPDAAGHGTEKVIEAVHKRMEKIPLQVVPVKLVATVITLASGGSAGKEGPCAQIGAGIVGDHVATLMGVQYPQHITVVAPQLTGGNFLETILFAMW
jgi:H+/Cl- antiporter ClcA